MRRIVQNRLDFLEMKTHALFNFLETIPSISLIAKTDPNQWSALEAVNHIYLSELLSLQYIQYKVEQPEKIVARRPDVWVRSMLLKLALRSPLKFKAPDSINMRGNQPVLPVDELKDVWLRTRSDLILFLEKYEGEWKHHLLYKHPVSGRMTLLLMVEFFIDHLDHHTRQIHRIVKNHVY